MPLGIDSIEHLIEIMVCEAYFGFGGGKLSATSSTCVKSYFAKVAGATSTGNTPCCISWLKGVKKSIMANSV
jgi:hypothetical protein